MNVFEVSRVQQVLSNAVNKGSMRFDAWINKNLTIGESILSCARKKLVNVDKWEAKLKIDSINRTLEDLSKQLLDNPDSFTDDHKKLMNECAKRLSEIQIPTEEETQAFLDSDKAVGAEELEPEFRAIEGKYIPGWDNEKDKIFGFADTALLTKCGLVKD